MVLHGFLRLPLGYQDKVVYVVTVSIYAQGQVSFFLFEAARNRMTKFEKFTDLLFFHCEAYFVCEQEIILIKGPNWHHMDIEVIEVISTNVPSLKINKYHGNTLISNYNF